MKPLFATLVILATLGHPAAAESPADLKVQPWTAGNPARSFATHAADFRGGLVLRVTGPALAVRAVGSSGFVSDSGVIQPLQADLPQNAPLRPDLPVTIGLSATLPDTGTWQGDVWLDMVDTVGQPLPRQTVRVVVKREPYPADALPLTLDPAVRVQHCLADITQHCPPPNVEIRGSVRNALTVPLPVPAITLQSFTRSGANLAERAAQPKVEYLAPCAQANAVILPGQSCAVVLKIPDAPGAGTYTAGFAAQIANAPLQTPANVSVQVRSSWWLMALLVSVGTIIAVLAKAWGQGGRQRIALLPDIAGLRDRALALATKQADRQLRDTADHVAQEGTALIGKLMNLTATVADPAVLQSAYAQKVDVLARWITAIKVVQGMAAATQQSLGPKVQAVETRLRAAKEAPDDALVTAFDTLLTAIDEARALAAARAAAAERLLAIGAARWATPPTNSARMAELEGLAANLQDAVEGNEPDAIRTASEAARQALAPTTEAVTGQTAPALAMDDVIGLLVSAGLPPATASEAVFRRTAFWWQVALAGVTLGLTCLAATQLLWFGTPDWGTPQNRLAAFTFGLAVGYGTQSVLEALKWTKPA